MLLQLGVQIVGALFLSKRARELLQIPADAICPISQSPMTDLVVYADGHSYQRVCIERWLALGHRTSPKTNIPLPHTPLIPNMNLRNIIQALEERMPKIQIQQLQEQREPFGARSDPSLLGNRPE